MDTIAKFASIDYVSLLSAVAIIVVGSVAAKEALTKFCNMLGIEFSWVRANKERIAMEKQIEEDIKDLSKKQDDFELLRIQDIESRETFNKTIVDSISSLKDYITTLEKNIDIREAEKRFKKLRFDILNFADRISKSEQISAELIDQIYDEITEYEELAETYEFKNNRVNASIVVIQNKYTELLGQGKIYKGEIE